MVTMSNILQVLLDVHGETAHFWELELWRTKQLPVSDQLQISNQWARKENFKQLPPQCKNLNLQQSKQVTAFINTKTPCRRNPSKSPKYAVIVMHYFWNVGFIWPPKICYDNDAPIWDCGVYMDMWILYGCHAGTRMGRRSTASSSGIETARLVVYKLETLLSFLILEYG